MQQNTKKKIGVIGEHPNNDAAAIIALLEQYVCSEYELVVFPTKLLRGGMLDSIKLLQNQLLFELSREKYECLILIRDLDDLASAKAKIKEKEKWFQKVNKMTGGINFFFLIIYELESLMLCDLDALNSYFQTPIYISKAPMLVKTPKEELTLQTKNSAMNPYNPSDSVAILRKLDFQQLYQNHIGEHSFQTFVEELKHNQIIDF